MLRQIALQAARGLQSGNGFSINPQSALSALRCMSTAKIIDGKFLAEDWENTLKLEASELTKELGRQPGLAMILAGERPDSTLYVRRKQEACLKVCPFLRYVLKGELRNDSDAMNTCVARTGSPIHA